MRTQFVGTAVMAVLYLVTVVVSGHVLLWSAVAWPILTVAQSGNAVVFWRAWRRSDAAYRALREARR